MQLCLPCNLRNKTKHVCLFHLHPSCPDLVPKPVCLPEHQQQGFQECRKLYDDAFMDCHMAVPPQIYVDSCVYDYCSTAGDREKLCASLESYVAACEINGVDLGDWRKDTVCGELCSTSIFKSRFFMRVSKLYQSEIIYHCSLPVHCIPYSSFLSLCR